MCLQEYDNDVETLISGVSVNPDDEDIERDIKLAHVDMYNIRLTERERRKTYVLVQVVAGCYICTEY